MSFYHFKKSYIIYQLEHWVDPYHIPPKKASLRAASSFHGGLCHGLLDQRESPVK